MESTRRAFIKTSIAAPAAALAFGQAVAQDVPAVPKGLSAAGPLPKGTLGGTLEVSRLLLGGNLLTHFTHSRDLQYVYDLAAHYNTEQKIAETMALAEHHGINTLVIHTVPWILDLLKRYRERMGGAMQYIICTTAPIEEGLDAYRESVDKLVEDGFDSIYVWGVQSDKLVEDGKAELIAKAVEHIKTLGVPAGVGAHDLKVVEECEKLGVKSDFYIKTFHHHHYPTGPKPEEITAPTNEIPGYWCADPEKTIAVMKNVEKPWIAFKVMAAGAIEPKNAFEYVFENGADHILAGMFDFEVEEDATLIREVLENLKRERPWRS